MVDTQENESGRVGIEISGKQFRAVLLDANGSVASSRSEAADDAEPRPQQLIKFVNVLRSEWGEFQRLGLSVPGLVDRQQQRVAFSAHIPEHSDIDLVKDVQSATGLKVIIENDANAAAFAEFKLGAGSGSRNIFYATLGDGIGGALILNGEIWRGAAGFAGEFGYAAINSEGTRLEDVASSSNIIRRTRSRFHQDSTSSLNSLPEEAITLSAIIAAAEDKDDFAQMMLKRTGAYVGGAVANVINLLNVEKIVVGGEIMKARHLVLDAIIERAYELSFRPSFESTKIVEGALGENAAAVGAAILGDQSGR